MRLAAPLIALLAACAPDAGLTLHDNNQPPEVTILAPASEEGFVQGQTVTFEAHIQDDADALEDLQWTWRSTNGGALGGDEWVAEGRVVLVTSALAPGEHTVSLTVVDLDGESASTEVRFQVRGNLPPIAAFGAPTPESVHPSDRPVQVNLGVSDDWDAGSDIELAWGGVAEGLPGLPATVDALGEARFELSDLAVGSYVLTVVATDKLGVARAQSVSFSVANPDFDGDGHRDPLFGGLDCDDQRADVYPGADEVCDGADNNCSGHIDDDPSRAPRWYYDNDLDGYGNPDIDQRSCTGPGGKWVDRAGDCNDSSNAVFPGNPELCDGLDNDCLGGPDDGLVFTTWYLDDDGDGYGDPNQTQALCNLPGGKWRLQAGDCDDTTDLVHPDRTEVCNGIDDNCTNGTDDLDPGLDLSTATTWYLDEDGDHYGLIDVTTRACALPASYAAAPGDCDDDDALANPSEQEVCDNGVDDDCLGGPDDGCVADYSGVWAFYVPGTDTPLDVSYGCDGWTFSFDTVLIDDQYPQLEITALGDTTVRVNGCEPGLEMFCTDVTGMPGTYDSAVDWTAIDAIEPLFGMGYYEIYEWLAPGGEPDTFATFTDESTFEASFSWRFTAASGSAVPPSCVDGHVDVEGRRQ